MQEEGSSNQDPLQQLESLLARNWRPATRWGGLIVCLDLPNQDTPLSPGQIGWLTLILFNPYDEAKDRSCGAKTLIVGRSLFRRSDNSQDHGLEEILLEVSLYRGL